MSNESGTPVSGSASDPKSRFEAGMAMLSPDRPLSDWQRGVILVQEASVQGWADASEQCAVFRSMGVGRPVDWGAALDSLALAAEQGSRRATRQLAVLARLPDSQASPSNLRARIDPVELLKPPEVELLSISPRIGILRQFATIGECQWLIEATRAKLSRSTIFDHKTGDLVVDERRTAQYTICNPVELGIVVEVIRARLSRAVGLPLPNFEMSQMLHYSEGQEFKPHHDYFDPAMPGYQAEVATNGQRVATQLIYLNEDFEGGETNFPSINLTYRGQAGDALVFFNINERGDPEPLTLHAGLPPTKGEKWLFSQWIRDRRATGGTGTMALGKGGPV